MLLFPFFLDQGQFVGNHVDRLVLWNLAARRARFGDGGAGARVGIVGFGAGHGGHVGRGNLTGALGPVGLIDSRWIGGHQSLQLKLAKT